MISLGYVLCKFIFSEYSVHFESIKSDTGRKRKEKEMVTEAKRKQKREWAGRIRK
jgi:hypothetical protein